MSFSQQFGVLILSVALAWLLSIQWLAAPVGFFTTLIIAALSHRPLINAEMVKEYIEIGLSHHRKEHWSIYTELISIGFVIFGAALVLWTLFHDANRLRFLLPAMGGIAMANGILLLFVVRSLKREGYFV